MNDAVQILGAAVAAAVFFACVYIVLTHGRALPLSDRLGMTMLAAGLIWGGINRLLGRPFDLGDLIMITGVAVLLRRFLWYSPGVTAPQPKAGAQREVIRARSGR